MTVARYALLLVLSACAAAPPQVAAPPPPRTVAVASPPAPLAPAAVVPAAPPPLAELELATHRAFFTALRAHDAAALAALYAPEATVDLGLVEARGGDAVGRLATTLWTAFPDSRMQWRTYLASGTTVAVELAWTGTNTGPLEARAPTKRVLGTTAVVLETFAPSGLLASQRFYFDAASVTDDLTARLGRPHAFAGLPTTQAVAPADAPPRADDVLAMQKVMAAIASGSFKDVVALGYAESVWVDESRRRVLTEKSAIAAWAATAARAVAVGGAQSFGAGDYVVVEWGGATGAVVEVVWLDSGHVKEVRTYRREVAKAKR